MKRNSMVLESRIEIFRNIKNYVFPSMLNEELSKNIIWEVQKIFETNNSLKRINIDENSKLENELLAENNIISKNFLERGFEKIVYTNSKGLYIVLNDEDHIKIIFQANGNNLLKCYKEALDIINTLEKSLEFAFDEKFGYLTSSLKNTGIGIKASVLMHLPLLALSRNIEECKKAIECNGISVNKLYDTNEEAGIYVITTSKNLGITEDELLENLYKAAEYLKEKEEEIRIKLVEIEKLKIQDEVYRAYGILRYAKIMSFKEAVLLISYVKLGYELKLYDNISFDKIDFYKLIDDVRNVKIKLAEGKNKSVIEVDEIRAKYIKMELITS